MDSETKSAFLVLKPVCDKVALSPSKSTLGDLKATIGSVPISGLLRLKDYVIFPLELHLHNHKNLSQETLISLVECLKAVLQRISLTELKNFLKLYSLLFSLISNPQNPELSKDVPEELKLSVVECVAELFIKSDPSVLVEFYSRPYYPKLSFGVYTCNQIVKNEKFHTLRVSALNCLMIMTGSLFDDEVKKSCSNIVMLMLPGIVSLCQATAALNVTQNHQVTLMALRLWSHVVVLVMDDNLKVQKSDDRSLCKLETSTKEKIKQIMDMQQRTEAWLADTSKNLAPVFENIVSVRSHSHWKVRHELAVASDRVVSNCLRTMQQSLMFLIDALIVLAQDEIDAVSNAAKTALHKFSQKCEAENGKSLVENIEENFFHLVTKLPRIVNGTDENVQLSELTLLGGYLSLLGPARLPHMLNSSAHLEKLISALVHLMELDTAGAKIIEEDFIVKDYDEYESWAKKSKSWRAFRHFSNENLIKKLEDICCILSDCHGTFIAHHLLDLYETNSLHRKEITLILNLIAANELSKSKDVELMTAVLDAYLEPSLWNLPTSKHEILEDSQADVHSVRLNNLSLAEIKSNVVQVCLMIEGIGDIALAVGGEIFSPCLLQCLYLLLERAGSPLEVFSEAGLYTLNNIVKACGLKDMTSLIDSYSDYLIHHVSLRLKNVTRYPQVLNVFIVIISKCTVHALSALQEIINNVLMYSCDTFQDKNIVAFLHVFLTFVSHAQKWMPPQEEEALTEKPSSPLESQSVLETFLEHHRLKLAASNFNDAIEENSSAPEEFSGAEATSESDYPENSEGADFHSESDGKKDIPETIKITISILRRSLNFLPHKNESLQLLVLQILDRGILVMQDWTDELLPVVHKIWAPLVERFSSPKPLIIHHSFKLLLTMAKITKDFIRKRTIDEVLPKLFAFLTKSAKDSHLRDVGSAYRMTQQYKLQHILLDGLGQIIIDLDCLEKTSHALLTCSSVYLSSLQPLPLQQSTKKLFETVAKKYRDLTWLILVSLKEKIHFTPPDPVFSSYEFTSSQPSAKDFQKNVDCLLQKL
nr:PREDICTED: TELO2-interacting protein 1 homolog [Bemisia tabaci]